MRPILRVALAALTFAALAGPAGAQTIDPARVAAVQKATAEFVKLAAGSHTSGQPPRQSDPKVKALLDIVLDVKAIPSAKPLPFSELGKLLEWQNAVLKVGLVYLLAGTGFEDFTKAGNDPAFAQRTDRNGVEFAPEYGRWIDATLGIHRAVLSSVHSHVAANPKELEQPHIKQGLSQIRLGAAQTLYGAITTLEFPGYSDAWRRERMPAMLAVAPHLAQNIEADVSKELQGAATKAAANLPDPVLQAELKKLAAVFAR